MALALAFQATAASAQLRIVDTTRYDTASQMLLANEINESGEPYAEAIGYDLDQLDPMQPGVPDVTGYALGIENYEYSRYQLGVVIARSGLGLHMMWSPMVIAQAAMETDPSFDGAFTGGQPNGHREDDELMKMVMHFGHLANQMPPQNAWPQFGEFVDGDPHYAQPVDAEAFTQDFATLRWDRSRMTPQLAPAALGQTLMKQYLWAQDMLGAFHDAEGNGIVADGTVTPDLPDGTFNPDNGIFYGGDSLDGYVGQVLTAEAINKVKNLVDNLAFDGRTLGPVDLMSYDPSAGLRYFPHRIAVTEAQVPGLPPRVGSFAVVDPTSDLFDQASLLWGLVNFADMMDPGNSSDEAHVAYHSVFDGDPFPAPMAETGQPGPYDLMQGTAKVVFQNLMAMHYDADAGTFVDASRPRGSEFPMDDADEGGWEKDDHRGGDEHGDVRFGGSLTTVNAAYVLVALDSFLDVFEGTPLADQARSVVAAQADFLIDAVRDNRGLYSDQVSVNGHDDHGRRHDDHERGHDDHGRRHDDHERGRRTVLAQAAAVRGLYAAYDATGEIRYRDAANAAYGALTEYYYRPETGFFATGLGEERADYDPEVVAVLSGALREARLIGGHEDATSNYIEFWNRVANKMQLAEGVSTGVTGGDSDYDGIPYIPEQQDGLAPVFAQEAVMVLAGSDDRTDDKAGLSGAGDGGASVSASPNPFNPATVIAFDIPRAAHVSLGVYDVRGRTVQKLVNGDLAAGRHEVPFKGDQLASGLYYYILDVDGVRDVGKMTLLK